MKQLRQPLAIGGGQLLDGGPDLTPLARSSRLDQAAGRLGEREVGDPAVSLGGAWRSIRPRRTRRSIRAVAVEAVDAQMLGELAAAQRAVTKQVQNPKLAQGQAEVAGITRRSSASILAEELDQRSKGALSAVRGLGSGRGQGCDAHRAMVRY